VQSTEGSPLPHSCGVTQRVLEKATLVVEVCTPGQGGGREEAEPTSPSLWALTWCCACSLWVNLEPCSPSAGELSLCLSLTFCAGGTWASLKRPEFKS
jgi:hypothetical protein